jgi:Tol biopolymer transport system component
VDPGASKATERHISSAVRDKFIHLSLVVESGQPLAWSAEGHTMYFVADANGVKDIWRLAVDPESLAAVSGPERVTISGGWNLMPATSRTGSRLVFSRSTGFLRVWLFALEDQRRIGNAPPKPLTAPELDAMQPALSPDGRSLVIVGQHPGARRKLGLMMISVDHPEQVLTLRTIDGEAGEDMFGPRWSPDSSKVAYSYRRVSSGTPLTVSSSIRVVDARSREESAITSMWTIRRLAADNPWGWSPDGRWLLASGYSWTGLARLMVSDAPHAERTARPLVSSSDSAYFQASPSPDGRWVCAVRSRSLSDSAALVLIPVGGGELVPLLDDTSWDDKPRWSADGRIIYFLSRRGGGFDVWGVEFDSLRGRAIGPPFQITHFRSPDMRMPGLDRIGDAEISIVGDRLALPLQTLGGGIWMLQ